MKPKALDVEINEAVKIAAGSFDTAVNSLRQRVCANSAALWELWGRYPQLDRNVAIKTAIRNAAGAGKTSASVSRQTPSTLSNSTSSNPKRAVGNDHAGHVVNDRSLPVQPAARPVSDALRTAAVMANSILDRFLVNGKPVGDVTAAEAREWAGARKRDAQFVDMLTSGIPDNMVIRQCIKPDEAEKFWTKAA